MQCYAVTDPHCAEDDSDRPIQHDAYRLILSTRRRYIVDRITSIYADALKDDIRVEVQTGLLGLRPCCACDTESADRFAGLLRSAPYRQPLYCNSLSILTYPGLLSGYA